MSGTILISRAYRFSAAHRLHTDRLPEDVNRKIYGKCHNPNGHGHNYTVIVTVQVPASPEMDPHIDVMALDELVQRQVVERFDHQHLNYDPAFRDVVTTGENISRLIWDLLVNHIPFGKLARIGVVETRDNVFEYEGDAREPVGSDAPEVSGSKPLPNTRSSR